MHDNQNTGQCVLDYRINSDTHGYHFTCYRTFTAVPKEATADNAITEEDWDSPLLRSQTAPHASTSSGVLAPVCLFLQKKPERNIMGSNCLL